nr:hypothetical protein [Tanacetum cinerariifolium]GEW03732.1 hypothetical protein [Tanacetum cinerariifolium]
MEETLSKFMRKSVKRHEENSNMIKEIRASTDASIRNQGASIKTLEIQIGQMSKVLQERGFGSLPSSTEANPRDHVKSISPNIEADTNPIRRASFSVINLSTYLKLGLGELAHKLIVELEDMTVKYPKRIPKNVLAELRRDQVDDLMPTIEEGEVVEEFRARNDARMVSEIFGHPSDCNHDKKIHIDCAHNLKFSFMIGKDKLEYKGNNVVGGLINIPIFVGTFSILTNFAVLEDMNAYRDEGMGDVIYGEPFFREVGINA